MSDKTIALLAAGNALAARARETNPTSPRSLELADDWDVALTALADEVGAILRYNELLQIARDLAAAITLPGSNVRATDAVARLRALDGKPKKAPPPPSPDTPPPHTSWRF